MGYDTVVNDDPMTTTTRNYLAWLVNTREFPESASVEEQLQFFIRYAILAPSTHNSQPWRFRTEGNVITVLLNPERTLKVADPACHYAYISIGAAIENLRLAADYFGFRMTASYFPVPASEDTVARLVFEKEGVPRDDEAHLARMIPKRRTNRMPYSSEPLPESFFTSIKSANTPDHQVFCITDTAQKKAIAGILLESRVHIFDLPEFRRELAAYKRHNLTRSGLGMPGFTMGFPLFASFFTALAIRFTNVMKFIKTKERRLLEEETPVFLFIATRNDAKRDRVATGELLERIVLTAESYDVRSAIAAIPKGEAFAKLQDALGTTFHPQIFCRLGFSPFDVRHSPRLLPGEL